MAEKPEDNILSSDQRPANKKEELVNRLLSHKLSLFPSRKKKRRLFSLTTDA